jgi:hypothetical protein
MDKVEALLLTLSNRVLNMNNEVFKSQFFDAAPF